MIFELRRLYKDGKKKTEPVVPVLARILVYDCEARALDSTDGDHVIAAMSNARVTMHRERIFISGFEDGDKKGVYLRQLWMLTAPEASE